MESDNDGHLGDHDGHLGSTPVRYEVDDQVAIVTLDRPRRLNAVNDALVVGLCAGLDRAGTDGVAAVVLTGAGRAFSAGHDLKQEPDTTANPAALGRLQHLQDVTRKVRQLPVPVIAAVQGYALGAGCEFALCCDLVVAEPDAVFGFPEVEVGLGVTGGISHLLPLSVGIAKAKQLLLLGHRFGAEEALGLGLVNAVADDARTQALAWAREIANRPRLAVTLAKSSLDLGPQGDIEAAYEREIVASLALMGTPEAAAAAEAFRNRRAGSVTGNGR